MLDGIPMDDDVPALGMVLLAEASGARFLGNGRVLPATTALMSGDLVRTLLKLSSWTLGLERAKAALEPEAASRPTTGRRRIGEEVLLAAAFDHALEIAPRADLADGGDDGVSDGDSDAASGDGSGAHRRGETAIEALSAHARSASLPIDISALKALVRQIEAAFGRIPVDNALADRIVMAAWDRLFPEGPDAPLHLEG